MCRRDPGALVGWRPAPPARRSTVSLLPVSPSTVIALSVGATASRSVRRAAAAATRASVTTNTRSVAIWGAIMPPPLPSAATVTGRPPRRRRRTAVFGNASVVVIACPAAGRPSRESAATARRTPRSSRGRSTCTPIRPVAHGATSAGWHPSRRAARAVETSAVRSPSAPVHAFAFPACTRTPASRPPATRRRAVCTGAAGARFTVNTPAAVAGGSAAMRATSGPLVFIPQRTPGKRKPGTRTRCARRVSFTPSSSPVALLVLLPATARAGIVPPDLVAVAPHGLDLLRRGRAAVRQRHARRLALPALHRLELGRERLVLHALHPHKRPRARRLGAELHAHQLLGHVRIHAPDHVLEHVVPLLLVGLEGVHLPVAAQPDALLQVIHVEEVVLPERVERLEHDELFQVAHDGRAEGRLALLVDRADALDEEVLERADAEAGTLLLGQAQAEVELREHRVVDRLPVPLLGGRLGVGVGGDQVLGDALGQLERVAPQVVAREEVAPARVDHLALLVEHVVVLEEVLADVEVVRLDLLLRVADGARDEAVLDRYALLHPEPLHQVLHPVGAEDAQQVVLQREVETRRAGVALPAAAAAQLVVDPARLVPLGAEDVEAAGGDHQLVLLGAGLLVLLEDLLVARFVLLRRLLELLADLLDRGDVLGAVRLVAPLGGAQRLLVGAASPR